jgi:hypothetical protein
MKERANKRLMKGAREVVDELTPEECKWFLLNRVFADNFPDVLANKRDRWIAVWGQETIYDQLVADHG